MSAPTTQISEQPPDFESMSPEDRIAWAADTFGDQLFLSTSFGVQSAVMLNMVNVVIPGIPVVFVDTGYHFPETYTFAEELSKRLDLNLKIYQPTISAARQEALWGKRWEQGIEGIDAYNQLNKVEPMNRAVGELNAIAWLSGLRRSQTSTRENIGIVQKQNKTFKIHPIADWSDRDVYQYLTKHNLPYHPLWEEGYVSIGDWHSTRKLGDGMSEEDTRFGGLKRECGLHEYSERADYQI